MPMILRQYALLGQPMTDGANTAEIAAPSQTIQMAVVVISLVPIVLVFPFLQRYFTKGVLIGAVKG
ncbi:ABC-type sugar transport system, permease component [Renibacterium salmoninarum ATCC 33209]|uniref:ABC-type sugar transport system, permease component n=1 Tax=Renibacterium salmoninarum (strain ATCC 33209 / DSM 20767 / JCM 11484 / NBRC 15589 / NCIMB 2235) TaxID=288705 RepID=A9WKR3_RENSM|nr:ABC-type sugar transport system, permease component [Renibacterium salmoninarum ATCC 33209]